MSVQTVLLVIAMLNALTLMEVLSACVIMDTQEMDALVKVQQSNYILVYHYTSATHFTVTIFSNTATYFAESKW